MIQRKIPMTVQTELGELYIAFQYDPHREGLPRWSRACIVQCFPTDDPFRCTGYTSTGLARCSSRDHFSRRTGRAIALSRALTGFSLSVRKGIANWHDTHFCSLREELEKVGIPWPA